MASLECREKSWCVVFRYQGKKDAFTAGEVSRSEADGFRASTEELLRLLARNIVALPASCSIEDFMFHRGKPPEVTPVITATKKELTLVELREAYFRSQEKKLEQTTLEGISLHFDHVTRLLGEKAAIPLVTRATLQGYVDKRSEEWIDPERHRRARRAKAAAAKPKRKYTRGGVQVKREEPPERPKRHPSAATIKKEIVSLRTAWNWARRNLGLAAEFPGGGLDYAKTEESLPFMTWEEAERRVRAGDDPEQVWDSVYLRTAEINDLLAWMKDRPVSPWVYPMFCFAAHTGVRRSEIVRAAFGCGLASGVITIREKKRDKARYTTRRVPVTPFLKTVLVEWVEERAHGKTLFCKDDGKAISPREAHNYFQRGLRTSSWSVLKGWHVFRHSFISALASKGIDQRVIDDLVGHSTDEQRRRYRHLYPDVKQQAVLDVFS